MAVHILTLLAHKPGERMTSETIAASVKTNPVVIRRLLLALRKAGLVQTRKGAGFGSRLDRLPSEIHLAEVYRAVEGAESFLRPVRKTNAECPVAQSICSSLERVCADAQTALESALSQITLAELESAVQEHPPVLDAVA